MRVEREAVSINLETTSPFLRVQLFAVIKSVRPVSSVSTSLSTGCLVESYA